MFGRPVPTEIIAEKGQPVRYWGARAIFKPFSDYPIDLLPDRQTGEFGDYDPQPLMDWINSYGLPELKKSREFKNLSSDSREVVEIKKGQFTLQACPNASYGYLYIGAWQYFPKGTKYNQKTPDPAAKWSGTLPIPAIGDKIVANINGRWEGKVTGYFVEHEFQGIEVECSVRPDWKVKQAPEDKRGLFFGVEIKAAA